MLDVKEYSFRPLVLFCLLLPALCKNVEPVVMTRNLYLGADLAPIFAAVASGGDVGPAALSALSIAMGPNNFHTRANAIATEINTEKPDLVGLQEVTTFSVGGVPVLDFEAVLLPLLSDYEKVIKTSEGVFAVPNVGALETANVILKRTRADLVVSNHQAGVFTSQPASFMDQQIHRNWQSVDASLGGKRFLFLNTHLETENDNVSTAQALELVAGPLNTRTPVVAAGDFNSDVSTAFTGAYRALTSNSKGKLRDLVRAGSTCCRAEVLTIPEAGHPEATLTERIDLVLASPSIKLLSGKRTGVNQVGGVYPSDHTGVVAKCRLP